MYLLLCWVLLGFVSGNPITEVDTTNSIREQYVLPGESIPTFYDVRLFLDPTNVDYFTGEVSIRFLPTIDTDMIVLHAMEMSINNIEVYSDRDSLTNVFDSYTLAQNDTHFLRIRLNGTISPMQPHTIHINYTGQYAENMFGIYVSTYQSGQQTFNLITSQLQPTFARRAFPCYDEPALKAIFRTTIYAPPTYSVVRSNMPERTDMLKPNVPGYVKHEFQDTLVMSTYLHAYLVSNFEYIDNENDPIYHIPFKVFSRPGTQDTAAFALDYGQKNMVALENYTEFAYEFPKMDKAAVPDFAAGAMENWGLVIYREVALLVQDGVTPTATLQNIGRIICHENVHMWFGNEVSPLSWTFTWLNEGFANFFENYGTDLVLPEWRMMDQYVLLLQNVMQNDAVLSVNPMTHPVYTPSEILGTFNAVAYQKSGSVIRMMQHALTPEIFRKGLVIYIRNNSRGAAAPGNLYAALQQALDESNHTSINVATIFDRWANQGGFPVITVRRTSGQAESIFISQQRFLTDSSLSSNDRWAIPVNWVLSTNINFNDTSPQGWVPASGSATTFDIPGLSQAEWFIVNKQQTGYYRVNYEDENWQALARVLNASHQVIHVLNRAQIIDDSFNLARNGRLNYLYAFEISRYLVQEVDYIPWASANTALNYLDIVLSSSEVYDLFQTYMLELTAPLYEQLGFDAQPNEEHVTAYHRNIILNINCNNGNSRCVNRAEELLQQYRNNPAQRINPDIQTTVFCSGLRGGNADNFNFLWSEYVASNDASERGILLNALGCTSDATLRDFFLNQVIDDNSPVRDQDRHSIIVSVINSSPENMDAALEFVLENFPAIQSRVQGLSGTSNILNAFARRLNSEHHNSRVDEFFRRHEEIFTAAELATIGAIRENIGASIFWNSNNLARVESWLRENFGSSASTALTPTLLILLSFFITIFNKY